MKISITNESGDWKQMLYTKDKVIYEVKSREIKDFFSKLSEAYINNIEKMDEMYECLYNLINYGYLYVDDEVEDDYYNSYDDYSYDDMDEDDDFVQPNEGIKLIDTEIEYFVDGEKVTKEEYDDTWDQRLGSLGSTHWDDEGLCITNLDTDEVIFSGRI